MSGQIRDPGKLPYGIPPRGYRLPDGIRLGPVRLQVADLKRSLDFYREVLGLAPFGQAVLGPEGSRTPLVELHENRGAAPVPRRGRLGLFHFAVLLPDRASLGSFVAHVGRTGVPLGASDHRVSEALYLHDPDGLGVEVYADRPRASWEHRGRQLVMSTDPLDLEDLVAAAGGNPCTGMPPGTVIGHVHLHVGDLEAAEAFYHHGLGLDKTVWDYPGALFLSGGGYHHHLGLNTWARGAEPAGADDARLLEWEIELPSAEDARAALESLAAAGHEAEKDDARGGRVRDPWGTALRLVGGG
jgi:catechol 2,3-dioxygenase